MPPVRYFLYGGRSPLAPDDPALGRPLPCFGKEVRRGPLSMTCGRYFRAAEEYLATKDLLILKRGLDKIYGICRNTAIDRVDIFLEKHGAFYHPFRIVVCTERGDFPFVLNAAVSDQGRVVIRKEEKTLSLLAAKDSEHFLPRTVPNDFPAFEPQAIPMFLGEWFPGYCEFHISEGGPKTGMICTWDGSAKRPVSNKTAAQIYRRMAAILTRFYDPYTSEHIRMWHNAAGDFVVKTEGKKVSVRLVSARDYGPLTEKPVSGLLGLLKNLFFFFIDLMLRIRLDRIDGTGPIVLGPPFAVKEGCRGFLDEIDRHEIFSDSKLTLKSAFLQYAGRMNQEEIRIACKEVLLRRFSEEERCAVRRLDLHSDQVFMAIEGSFWRNSDQDP